MTPAAYPWTCVYLYYFNTFEQKAEKNTILSFAQNHAEKILIGWYL